jgi:hypothetical protein
MGKIHEVVGDVAAAGITDIHEMAEKMFSATGRLLSGAQLLLHPRLLQDHGVAESWMISCWSL